MRLIGLKTLDFAFITGINKNILRNILCIIEKFIYKYTSYTRKNKAGFFGEKPGFEVRF